MDDIILTSNKLEYLYAFIHDLNTTFALKDLGSLHEFLGILISRTSNGFYLNQSQYISNLLSNNLSKNLGHLLVDPTPYRNALGTFQYLTQTRLDVSFVVNKLNQFIQQPTTTHRQSVKRILDIYSAQKTMAFF